MSDGDPAPLAPTLAQRIAEDGPLSVADYVTDYSDLMDYAVAQGPLEQAATVIEQTTGPT